MISNLSSSYSSQNSTMRCDDPSENSDVSELPELFSGDSLLELCNSFWMRSPGARQDVQPYLRGCKWSPDGTCCLSVVNRDGFHIMELPRDLYEGCPNPDRMITLLPAVIHVKEAGLIYDFCWYPKMNSHYPDTCSWISTKINSPIQMWDAYDGSLKCSYRGYNAVDEMEPAISVTFINHGERIVGGYKNCLRTFDVERPGRDFLEHKIKSPASCFATHGSLLAVGSWNASIKLFNIHDNGTYKSVGNLHAHSGGITHLQFTPDGTKLVSGARKDHNLCVWDIRYHRRPLNILKRSVSTNQRIYFDISKCGRYLVSGGTDGVIRVWDSKFTKWTEQFDVKDANEENATFRFRLHRDCCNSVSIHPSRPILATGSGQYHFLDPVKVLEIECESSKSCIEDSVLVDSKSATNGSSDELENINTSFSEIHKNSDNSSREIHEMESPKELDHNVEVSPSKRIASETCSESSPAKKPRWSNDINSLKEAIYTESPVSTPNIESYSINFSEKENTNEEHPRSNIKITNQLSTKEADVYETTIEANNFFIGPEINAIDEPANQLTKYTHLPPTMCSVITAKEPEHRTSKCNAIECIVKDNTDIIMVNEPDVVLNKSTNLTNTDENTELGRFCGSHVFDNSPSRLPKRYTDSQLSPLSEMDRLSSNVNIEKLLASEHIRDNALESEDDYNDDIENKIKYSSYAENNLTFWWIAKIFND